MEAHEFIRKSFKLSDKVSIDELPEIPVSTVVELMDNYKKGKVKEIDIPTKKGTCGECIYEYRLPDEKPCDTCGIEFSNFKREL